MEFPMSVLLKSNDNSKFLCYRKKESGNPASSLNFSQEDDDDAAEIQLQYMQFEIQEAKSVKGLVHIRSCYNHKYWTRKSADSKWIVAEANEPDEDQSKSSCTLFQIIPLDSDEAVSSEDKPRRIRLMHIDHLGKHYAFKSTAADDHNSELALDDEDSVSKSLSDDGNYFVMYNVSSRVVLPDVVAFKGYNGMYCSPITINGDIYMELNATDIAQEGVLHHIYNSPFPPFFIRIDNPVTRYYWLLAFESSNVVAALRTGLYGVRQELFVPISLGNTIIALRADTVGFLVQSVSALNRENMLRASATTIINQARFEVVEPVFRRVVDDVKYDLSDSRIYDVGTVIKYGDVRENDTSVEQTGTFQVSYKISQSTNWNHGVSMTTGITAGLSARIPFVGSFGVELSAEKNQQREWGVEEVEEQTIEYVQNMTIPPGKRISLRVIATKAFCDVPFTCEVSDTLTDGTIRAYTKTDGRFEGSNEYNFVSQMIEEDL